MAKKVLTPINKGENKDRSKTETYSAYKVSIFGIILVRIFPHSD